MVKIKDRIVVESEKVGTPPRSGVVTAIHGSLVRVEWDDGTESEFVPASGSLTIAPEKAAKKTVTRKAAKKTIPRTAKKTIASKAAQKRVTKAAKKTITRKAAKKAVTRKGVKKTIGKAAKKKSG